MPFPQKRAAGLPTCKAGCFILKLMEKNGFIFRECSKEDGRMKEIIPTEKSLAMQKEIVENIRSIETKLREGIPPEDYQTCIDVLKKMIENLV